MSMDLLHRCMSTLSLSLALATLLFAASVVTKCDARCKVLCTTSIVLKRCCKTDSHSRLVVHDPETVVMSLCESVGNIGGWLNEPVSRLRRHCGCVNVRVAGF